MQRGDTECEEPLPQSPSHHCGQDPHLCLEKQCLQRASRNLSFVITYYLYVFEENFKLLKATDFQFLKSAQLHLSPGKWKCKTTAQYARSTGKVKKTKRQYQVIGETWNNKNLHILLQGRVNWHNCLEKIFDSTYYGWVMISIFREKWGYRSTKRHVQEFSEKHYP